ncbi:hypothetical protein HDV05_007846 [Chytridiales sp. JEL 0842]|nr:hypothetical protein HDV05_007846 [Chytridiales sp. JEL 0842]
MNGFLYTDIRHPRLPPPSSSYSFSEEDNPGSTLTNKTPSRPTSTTTSKQRLLTPTSDHLSETGDEYDADKDAHASSSSEDAAVGNKPLGHLLDKNKRWADKVHARQPGFLQTLGLGQAPEILWIGCSDSRVVPETLLSLPPGSLFTHRNIANIISPTDPSLLSCLYYAIEVLKVKHVIVCGHEDCGGCKAVLSSDPFPKQDQLSPTSSSSSTDVIEKW